MSSLIESLKQSFQSETKNVFLLNESKQVIWNNNAELLDGVPSSYIDDIFNQFFINGAENLKFNYEDFIYFCNVISIPDEDKCVYVFQFSKKLCDNSYHSLQVIANNIYSDNVYNNIEAYKSEAISIIINMFQSILVNCDKSENYEIVPYIECGLKGAKMLSRSNMLSQEFFYCCSNEQTTEKTIVNLSQTCEDVINGCDNVLREKRLEFPCNIEDNIFVNIPPSHLKTFLILIILRLYRQNVDNKQFSISLTKNKDYAIFLAKSSYECPDGSDNKIDLLEGLEKYIVTAFCKKFNITLMDFKDSAGCPNISLKIPICKSPEPISFRSAKRIYGSTDNTKVHRILLCNIITESLNL